MVGIESIALLLVFQELYFISLVILRLIYQGIKKTLLPILDALFSLVEYFIANLEKIATHKHSWATYLHTKDSILSSCKDYCNNLYSQLTLTHISEKFKAIYNQTHISTVYFTLQSLLEACLVCLSPFGLGIHYNTIMIDDLKWQLPSHYHSLLDEFWHIITSLLLLPSQALLGWANIVLLPILSILLSPVFYLTNSASLLDFQIDFQNSILDLVRHVAYTLTFIMSSMRLLMIAEFILPTIYSMYVTRYLDYCSNFTLYILSFAKYFLDGLFNDLKKIHSYAINSFDNFGIISMNINHAPKLGKHPTLFQSFLYRCNMRLIQWSKYYNQAIKSTQETSKDCINNITTLLQPISSRIQTLLRLISSGVYKTILMVAQFNVCLNYLSNLILTMGLILSYLLIPYYFGISGTCFFITGLALNSPDTTLLFFQSLVLYTLAITCDNPDYKPLSSLISLADYLLSPLVLMTHYIANNLLNRKLHHLHIEKCRASYETTADILLQPKTQTFITHDGVLYDIDTLTQFWNTGGCHYQHFNHPDFDHADNKIKMNTVDIKRLEAHAKVLKLSPNFSEQKLGINLADTLDKLYNANISIPLENLKFIINLSYLLIDNEKELADGKIDDLAYTQKCLVIENSYLEHFNAQDPETQNKINKYNMLGGIDEQHNLENVIKRLFSRSVNENSQQCIRSFNSLMLERLQDETNSTQNNSNSLFFWNRKTPPHWYFSSQQIIKSMLEAFP